MRKIPCLLALVTLSTPALSGEEELYGVWTLASMQRELSIRDKPLKRSAPTLGAFSCTATAAA